MIMPEKKRKKKDDNATKKLDISIIHFSESYLTFCETLKLLMCVGDEWKGNYNMRERTSTEQPSTNCQNNEINAY